jgi:hypothetical protein
LRPSGLAWRSGLAPGGKSWSCSILSLDLYDRRKVHDAVANLVKLVKGVALSALITAAGAAHATTYVYVSNGEDGDIGMYTMESDGTLKPGGRVEAGKLVAPMSASPDKRFLFAAVRTKPFTAVTYAIDRKTGALKQVAKGPLAESLPYILTDKTGRSLLGASYGGHLVTVNPIGKDGKVGEPQQVIPTARNAHSIITDKTNRYKSRANSGDTILKIWGHHTQFHCSTVGSPAGCNGAGGKRRRLPGQCAP